MYVCMYVCICVYIFFIHYYNGNHHLIYSIFFGIFLPTMLEKHNKFHNFFSHNIDGVNYNYKTSLSTNIIFITHQSQHFMSLVMKIIVNCFVYLILLFFFSTKK